MLVLTHTYVLVFIIHIFFDSENEMKYKMSKIQDKGKKEARYTETQRIKEIG